MAKKTQKTAYNAGASAFTKGKGGEQNPHETDSPDCKAWEHGYLDRQKMLSNTRRPPSAAARQAPGQAPARPSAHH